MLLTKSLQNSHFRKLIKTNDNNLFKFIKSILPLSSPTASTYRQRAQILIPFVKKIMPNQVKDVTEPHHQIRKVEVDCFSNPGDCVKFIVGEKFPAFRHHFSECTNGHPSYVESSSNLSLTCETLKNKEEWHKFFTRTIKNEENVGCGGIKNNGDTCHGRLVKHLFEMGKNFCKIFF